MILIRPTIVRRLAHGCGKRVSRSYLQWLNKTVFGMIAGDMHALGSRKTLSAADAEARRAFRR